MRDATAAFSTVLPGPLLPPRHPFVSFHQRLFRQKPLGAIGGVLFVVFLFCGIFADDLYCFGRGHGLLWRRH